MIEPNPGDNEIVSPSTFIGKDGDFYVQYLMNSFSFEDTLEVTAAGFIVTVLTREGETVTYGLEQR